MREFVGKEALKEIESCMPKGGGSDCDVLLVRVMLSSERDGDIHIHTFTIAFTQWRVPRGGGVEGRHAHRAFELAVIIIHRPLNIEVKALK
jgi:hypothetical protein